MFSTDNTGMYMPVAPANTAYDNAQTDHERAELQDVINYIQRKNMG